jgi:hypothetical protein
MNRIDCRSEKQKKKNRKIVHMTILFDRGGSGNSNKLKYFLSIDLRMETRRMDGLVMLDEF